jgi:MFS family permease
VGPMVFALLATEVPSERRSATLNLVYLPLYAAGIIGPAIGAVLASGIGIAAPYIAGALVLVAGSIGIAITMRGAAADGRHERPAAG